MTCPIAGYRIDEKSARVAAGFVLLLVALALWSGPQAGRWIYLFLAHDFGFRAFSLPRLSVLGRLASLLLRALKVAPQLVDAGPKRFAARVGMLFSLALLFTAGREPQSLHFLVAGILAICASLESLIGFCVGCTLWTAWYSLLEQLRTRSSKEG